MQILFATTTAMVLSLGTFLAMNAAPEESASAELLDAAGRSLGTLHLKQQADGVRISGRLVGLLPGIHAMHIHTVGQCHGPEFKTAGGHFNPFNRKHGMQNKDGPHAGDLPNFTAGPDGNADIDCLAPLVTLLRGKNSLFPAKGTCLVVHDKADDDVTDPTGDAGDRIACGLIRK